MDNDPFGLARFVSAQDSFDAYQRVLAELRAGRKTSHWMWFIFPQVAGLGSSHMAQRYAISGLPEARAYLGHPVLGPRLAACTAALTDGPGRTAAEILGPVDAIKLRSCMTLFAAAAAGPTAPAEPAFDAVLAAFFDGQPDPATLDRL